LPASEKFPITPQKTDSTVAAQVPTSGKATIKTSPSAISTQAVLKRPNETAVLPVELKKNLDLEQALYF
jgi:hypothetical protein